MARKAKRAEDAPGVLLDGQLVCAECHGEMPCPKHQSEAYQRAREAVTAEAERLGLKVSKVDG